MNKSPSPNGSNGTRCSGGRFAKGNPGGPGNPHARKVARLRATLLRSVSAQDMRDVVEALKRQAKGGNIPAVKELLERLLGKPVELDFMERLDRLEQLLAQRAAEGEAP